MRAEGSLASDRELASERSRPSSERSTKRQRSSESMTTRVQMLFETCREVFADGQAGNVPSPEDVDRLRFVLDNMNALDVGLAESMPYFRNIESGGTPPRITYLHLCECDNFSIGIFCFPPSGVIPLHNHPGMTVFSKLLFGSLHIKSYDWVDIPQDSNYAIIPAHFQPPGVRLAKVKTDAIFTAPCETSVLYPADGGNMHRFSARTSCAVLDVLGPPYSDSEGRPCTYYNDFPLATFPAAAVVAPGEDEDYAWLEEREKPDDFIVVGARYRGPRIVES
ncbi:plant cysteine oxidase 2 isoform X2 [Elaeis guineensis]|uniref:cysteine dioxygenase n=1 Tax=Elaeis guineensis var. tenera TaxID=51953 RepID=A0A6I9QVU0_ELAGV|nr:plant cysteine oxidase 2 isoform X2 [Elaeis guineensis]